MRGWVCSSAPYWNHGSRFSKMATDFGCLHFGVPSLRQLKWPDFHQVGIQNFLKIKLILDASKSGHPKTEVAKIISHFSQSRPEPLKCMTSSPYCWQLAKIHVYLKWQRPMLSNQDGLSSILAVTINFGLVMLSLNHKVLSGHGFVTTFLSTATYKDLNQWDKPQGRFGECDSEI